MELNSFLSTFRYRSAERWLARNTTAKLTTIALFLLVIAGLLWGIYGFIFAGLEYLQANPAVAAVVSAYIYELFLLVISLLVVGSTLISGLFSLFRSRQQGMIVMTPASADLFGLNLRSVTGSGSWPLALFFGPAAFALQSSFDLSELALIEALTGIVLLSVLLSLLTVAAILLMATALNSAKRLTFTRLAGGVVGISVIGLALLAHWAQSGNLFDLSSLPYSESSAANVSAITQRFRLLPTHPLAQLLYALQSHGNASVWLLVLLFAAALSYLLVMVLARNYITLWQRLQEGQLIAKSRSTSLTHPLDVSLRLARTPLAAVTAKEMLLFRRDRQQLLWFGFLVGMWAVQTILVSGTVRHDLTSGDTSLLKLIQPLQFLVTLYFVATAALRFVFPSFSAERRSAWLIASTPLDLRQLLQAKSAWFTGLFVVAGVVISGINFSILGLSGAVSGYTALLLVVAIITLVQLSLCLGICFPNFETDDPQALSTSLPGLFLIALSLIYGGFGALALRNYINGSITPSLNWLLFSLVLCFGLYQISRARAARFEFVKITKYIGLWFL